MLIHVHIYIYIGVRGFPERGYSCPVRERWGSGHFRGGGRVRVRVSVRRAGGDMAAGGDAAAGGEPF